MRIEDDTPEPGTIPDVYPRNPPINLLYGEKLLNPGNFYAFEGIDAAGKSTLIREVTKILESRGRDVAKLKLAGSDLIRHAMERAKWLNVDPICFNLLNWVSVFHQTSRHCHLFNTSTLIFFDRYTMTIKARGRWEGLSNDYMDALERMIPRPRVTFLIDCDPDLSVSRVRANERSISYFESGVRHVPATGEPMFEVNESARSKTDRREEGFRRSQRRMREEFLRLASNRTDVVIIENDDQIEAAVDKILANIG
jgi:thymidylate kinase